MCARLIACFCGRIQTGYHGFSLASHASLPLSEEARTARTKKRPEKSPAFSIFKLISEPTDSTNPKLQSRHRRLLPDQAGQARCRHRREKRPVQALAQAEVPGEEAVHKPERVGEAAAQEVLHRPEQAVRAQPEARQPDGRADAPARADAVQAWHAVWRDKPAQKHQRIQPPALQPEKPLPLRPREVVIGSASSGLSLDSYSVPLILLI